LLIGTGDGMLKSRTSIQRRLAPAVVAVIITCLCTAQAQAAVRIVALGASNTAGKGVGRASAWPAQLEAMLRAKGYDVHVANAGINGDDTRGMLRRLNSAAPGGTQIVILDKAPANDRKTGADSEANIAAIAANLRARNVKLIVIPNMHAWVGQQLQPDGTHLTEGGHAAVAAKLVPLVISALSRSSGR